MKVFMYVLQLVAHISTDNRTLNILKNRDMMNLDISKMNDYITGNIAGTNKDNWVYINIWDYKPSWTIKRTMFKVKASSPSSTLTIEVTDEFGNSRTEIMTRPKDFTLEQYINEQSNNIN